PGRAKVLYEKVYCARGRMENLIKDMKLYTRSDRTSCHRWEANQFRLFLHMGAYWLLHELRGAAPKRSIWRTATFETIRCTFLKIAVRIQELKTRIKMALPSSYPHVQALTALATSIAALAPCPMRQVPRSPLRLTLQPVAIVPQHPPPSTRSMPCAHTA